MLAIEAMTTAVEPGTVAQWVAAESARRRPMRPSLTPNGASWENIPKKTEKVSPRAHHSSAPKRAIIASVQPV